MTPEQKTKAIVEEAGECWHEWERKYLLQDYVTWMFKCSKCDCSSEWVKGSPPNPSPTDLNELFRLAEKLGLRVHLKYRGDDYHAKVWFKPEEEDTDRVFFWSVAATPADALRTALYQAMKGGG